MANANKPLKKASIESSMPAISAHYGWLQLHMVSD